MEQCDECSNGRMVKKKVDYELLGVSLGKFDAHVCDACGETVFDAKTFAEVEGAAKAKEVWGIAAKTRIGTAGNALDVRLPKQLVEFLHLKKGQEVVIEPVDKKRFQVTLA